MTTVNNKETNPIIKVMLVQVLEYFRFTQMMPMIFFYTTSLLIILIHIEEHFFRGGVSSLVAEKTPDLIQGTSSVSVGNTELVSIWLGVSFIFYILSGLLNFIFKRKISIPLFIKIPFMIALPLLASVPIYFSSADFRTPFGMSLLIIFVLFTFGSWGYYKLIGKLVNVIKKSILQS